MDGDSRNFLNDYREFEDAFNRIYLQQFAQSDQQQVARPAPDQLMRYQLANLAKSLGNLHRVSRLRLKASKEYYIWYLDKIMMERTQCYCPSKLHFKACQVMKDSTEKCYCMATSRFLQLEGKLCCVRAAKWAMIAKQKCQYDENGNIWCFIKDGYHTYNLINQVLMENVARNRCFDRFPPSKNKWKTQQLWGFSWRSTVIVQVCNQHTVKINVYFI